MEIRKITEETMDDYLQVLDRDEAENIGRKYYRSLALHADAHVQGAMIWKLVHEQNGQKTMAQITCFYSEDQEAGTALLTEYEKEIATEGATGSCFQFSRDREETREVLEQAGFLLKEKKSRELIVTVDELSKLAEKGKPELPPDIVSIDQLMLRQLQRVS